VHQIANFGRKKFRQNWSPWQPVSTTKTSRKSGKWGFDDSAFFIHFSQRFIKWSLFIISVTFTSKITPVGGIIITKIGKNYLLLQAEVGLLNIQSRTLVAQQSETEIITKIAVILVPLSSSFDELCNFCFCFWCF
jgi:hypothetical protein